MLKTRPLRVLRIFPPRAVAQRGDAFVVLACDGVGDAVAALAEAASKAKGRHVTPFASSAAVVPGRVVA